MIPEGLPAIAADPSEVEETELDRPLGDGQEPPRRSGRRRKERRKERRARRTYGRFRRWVVRPLFWTLAGLAVVIFTLQLMVDTPWARETARVLIVQQLSRYFDREVAIADIYFELLPLTVEVWGLTIGGPEGIDDPFLHVPWAAIDADIQALRDRRVRLEQIRVERPVISLDYFIDGTHNMIRFQRTGRQRRFEVFIDRLEIDQAVFTLDQQRVQLSLAAESIQARMRGLGEMHMGGQLVTKKVTLRLPRASPISLSVAAQGSWTRNRVDIQSASIRGPDFETLAEGSCQWTTGSDLGRRCSFQTTGSTRGELLQNLGYLPDLSGPLSFQGTLDWRPDLVGWSSQLSSDRLVAWDRELQDLRGRLRADRYGVRLDLERARYGGGLVEGEVVYSREDEGSPYIVDLDFRGVDLDTLLADQNIPITGCSSRVAGSLFYRFLQGRSRGGEGRAEVQLSGDSLRPGIELAGAFPLRITGGVIHGESISLMAARQSILAGGWYELESQEGSFDYEIASADLAELAPLLPLSAEDIQEPPLWLPTAGEGKVEGNLLLGAKGPSSDVRVRFERVVTPSLAARQVRGSFHVDRTAVDQLRLELTDEGRALEFTGRIPLVADERGTELAFDAYAWPLDQVRPWLGFVLPVDGQISGRLDLHVDGDTSDGVLKATVAPAALGAAGGADLEVDHLGGHLHWRGEEVVVESLTVGAGSGELRGSGTYHWGSGELAFDVLPATLELGAEPLQQFLPRSDLRGEVEVEFTVSGTWDEPRLEMSLAAEGLALGDRELRSRPSRFAVSWHDGIFETRGRLLDMMALEGVGVMAAGKTDLTFAVAGTDLAKLAELLAEDPPPIDGSFRGVMTWKDEDLGQAGAELGLSLSKLELQIRDREVASLGPAVLRFDPGGISIQSLDLVEEATGSRFRLSGGLGYDPEAPLDLELEAELSTRWLEFIDFQLDLEGRLDLSGQVGGTLAWPTFEGHGELREGVLSLGAGFPHLLVGLEGGMTIHPESVEIDRLAGEMAGGTVEITGSATLERPDRPLTYRLQIAARDLDLLYPEGWSLRGDSDLTIRSTFAGGSLIDGRATMSSIEYIDDIRFDFEQLMRGFLERQRLEVNPADSVLSSFQLDVEMSGPLLVANNLADLEGRAELVIRGNLTAPVFFGEVALDPGGRLSYNNTDYEIERGRVVFTNPYRFDPEIDLVASTRVRDFDVTLGLSGTFDRLDTRFSSDPPLPDLEVFRLLATGEDAFDDSSVLETRLAERIDEDPATSAASFLYGQAASVIGDRVNTLFGLDKFRIDPLTGTGDQLSKARITVGKRLSKDVFLTLSTDPSSTESQRLQIEWQVGPNLVLVLRQNGDNTFSGDARWETSF